MIGGSSVHDWEPYSNEDSNSYRPKVPTDGSGLDTYSEHRTRDISSCAESQAKWLERVASKARDYNQRQIREGNDDRKIIDEYGLAHVSSEEFRQIINDPESWGLEEETARLFDPEYWNEEVRSNLLGLGLI